MKRSRRVVLTMMGSSAIGVVSMGLVRPRVCAPGVVAIPTRGPDGRLVEHCPVTYGGFGGAPRYFHMHGGG
jgi:hypothetical protein